MSPTWPPLRFLLPTVGSPSSVVILGGPIIPVPIVPAPIRVPMTCFSLSIEFPPASDTQNKSQCPLNSWWDTTNVHTSTFRLSLDRQGGPILWRPRAAGRAPCCRPCLRFVGIPSSSSTGRSRAPIVLLCHCYYDRNRARIHAMIFAHCQSSEGEGPCKQRVLMCFKNLT